MRAVGIKMSWVEKNRKISNRGERLFGTREYSVMIYICRGKGAKPSTLLSYHMFVEERAHHHPIQSIEVYVCTGKGAQPSMPLSWHMFVEEGPHNHPEYSTIIYVCRGKGVQPSRVLSYHLFL